MQVKFDAQQKQIEDLVNTVNAIKREMNNRTKTVQLITAQSSAEKNQKQFGAVAIKYNVKKHNSKL